MILNLEKQVDAAHLFIKLHLTADDTAIDATCGNGQDTLYLASILTQGKVHALDIQEEAIRRTMKKLKETDLADRVHLHHRSHETFPEEISKGSVNLIIYNLGYLPGGDQRITTVADTTLKSLNEALKLLATDGALCIMLYPGHSEGARESQLITEWAKTLPSYAYVVQRVTRMNRNLSPELIWIQGIQRLSDSTGSNGQHH